MVHPDSPETEVENTFQLHHLTTADKEQATHNPWRSSKRNALISGKTSSLLVFFPFSRAFAPISIFILYALKLFFPLSRYGFFFFKKM